MCLWPNNIHIPAYLEWPSLIVGEELISANVNLNNTAVGVVVVVVDGSIDSRITCV